MRCVHSREIPWLLALTLAGGCSAIINPDKDKLGGANLGDGGTGGANGGSNNSGQNGGVDPCAPGCAVDQRCNPVRGCVPIACRNDLDCNDGSQCNGVEVCSPGAAAADVATGCVAGVIQSCDDGLGCTVDSCDPIKGCQHVANDTLCDDGVSCTTDSCSATATPGSDGCAHTADNSRCTVCHQDGVCSPESGGCVGNVPTNCNDGDACTGDTCDDALGMCVHGLRDDDGDGVAPVLCGGGDCNDGDASIHPNAPEVCDKQDDNCDGQIDEGCTSLPDSCGTKQVVTLSSGHADVSGTLSDFTSNYSNACGQSGGLDAVYAIPVDGSSDIVIDSEGSAARVVLAVSETCGDNAFTSLGCAGSITNNGTRSRLMLHRFTPQAAGGYLYLLVDGASANERGGFTISIDVTPSKGDACDDVMDLGACGTLIGYVSTLLGQQGGSCQDATGVAAPESVLHLTSPADKSVGVSVASNDFAPVLYARTLCDSTDQDAELGCDDSGNGNGGGGGGGPFGGQSGRAQLGLQADAGSDIYLFVDGARVGDVYLLKCVP